MTTVAPKTRPEGETPRRSRGRGGRKSDAGLSAILYDADGADGEIDLGDGIPRLSPERLLWLDVDTASEKALARAAELLDLPEGLVARLRDDELRPSLADYEDCLHVRAVDVGDNPESPAPALLDAVAGKNWLLTLHRGRNGRSDSFRAAFQGETRLGRLDSLSLLAALLESQVGGYFAAIARTEQEVEAFDEEVLRSGADGTDAALSRVVTLRRRVALLRRHLILHRDPYTVLADADVTNLGTREAAARFETLGTRLERAIDATDSARQMVVGSFEILMTRTGQRTNEIMKVLTLVSATLLPSSVIAGILGMNFEQPFFDHGFVFWVVLAAMAGLMAGVLAFARRRRWL